MTNAELTKATQIIQEELERRATETYDKKQEWIRTADEARDRAQVRNGEVIFTENDQEACLQKRQAWYKANKELLELLNAIEPSTLARLTLEFDE